MNKWNFEFPEKFVSEFFHKIQVNTLNNWVVLISEKEKCYCLNVNLLSAAKPIVERVTLKRLTRVCRTNASRYDRGRPRPWSKLPSELQDDWWQIEAREASRGPGPRLRCTSNQYQRAGASHVPRALLSWTLSSAVRALVCDLEIRICWPVTEERAPSPPPYVIDHDRGHEGCSKFCGLRGISVFPVANDAAAADCVTRQLQREYRVAGT